MSMNFYVLALLLFIATTHAVLIGIREEFRRKVKIGDIIGVELMNGEIENREVTAIFPVSGLYAVKGENLYIPRDKIYFRSNE